MKKRILQIRMTVKAMMIALLLGVVGKMYASYDFSAVCETGQTLYYKITNTTNHYVALTCPGSENWSGCWSGFTKPTGDIVLPESVQYEDITYTITEIGGWAFYQCRGLTGNLTIPNSVTTIKPYAFSGCSGLTGSLTLPNSVTKIYVGAFYCPLNAVYYTGDISQWCQIDFDAMHNTQYYSVGTNPLETAHNLFIDGELVTNLVIPETVVRIKTDAFIGATCLTSLTIPNSVKWIGQYAFFGCTSLMGSLAIPNSVTTIGSYAFSGCSGFTGSLTISNSVRWIEEKAFYNCSGFTGNLTIPNSVTSIGLMAFLGCSDFDTIVVDIGNNSYDSRENCNAIIQTNTNTLVFGCKNTIIPNSVTTIRSYAFSGCNGLISIEIPNSVTTIGEDAFSNCIGLTSVTIPSSVTSIGYSAFRGCSGLAEIMMLGTTPPSIGNNLFFNTSNCPIYVPYESLNDYKTATNWNTYESRIFPWLQKSIEGYGEDAGNWHFIASPCVANTAPTAVNNMITETAYDLYRFDQSEDLEWRNYEYPENTQDFMLVNGQGYLYANEEDVNLIFKGNFNEDEMKDVELVYDEGKPCAGWNLVGNPFPVSAYGNRSYYVMNEGGTAIEPVAVSMGTVIPFCTGMMVKSDNTGETVTFSKTAPEAAANQGVLQIALSQVVEPVETPVYRGDGPSTSSGTASTGSVTVDKAIVSFNAGDRLEKFVFNEDNAILCIPQGGKDFAIANAEKMGEMPLNFKASRNGQYTISVNPKHVEMDYLHLIDNMTGANIDLLATPSYTFDAKTTDYESRFKLVFSTNNTDGPSTGSGTFAFISNGNIIINGEGTVQVIDMAGHIIVSVDEYTRSIPTAGMTSGVYVLRLIEGDDVKTQKIVVR